MTGHAPGVYDIPEAEPEDARTETSDGQHWTFEGVARCPDCRLYFDVEAATTLPELERFIEAHDCVKEEMRYMPWQI